MTSEKRLSALFKQVVSNPDLKTNASNMLDFDRQKSCTSYFKPVDRPRLSCAEMESGADIDELEALARIWQASGGDLSDLIPELREIVQVVSDERDRSGHKAGSLSEYVYQMW